MKENKEETIKRLAYVIWQDRTRRGEFDANNSEQNYFRAKQVLYPDEMTIEELEKI